MSRFTKLGNDGQPLPADATQWAAVRDELLKVEWSAATIGENLTHKEATSSVQALALCGHTDWRLPAVEEAFLLADRTRVGPAIDTTYFPDTKNDGYWASSEAAGVPSCAWVVYFDFGSSVRYLRDVDCCVRAVRSVVPAVGQ